MSWILFVLSLVTLTTPSTGGLQDPPAKGTGRIAGTVVAADTSKPVSGVALQAIRWEGGRGYPAATRTDGQGHFEFRDLPPGSYQVTATASGFIKVDYGQRQPPEPGKRIELKDGELFDHADISLPRPSAIEGRLLDEFGDPAPGILVQVANVQFAAGAKRLMPVSSPQTNLTDDKGQFRIEGLSPGNYYLVALSGPFASTSNGAMPGPSDTDRAGFASTFFPGTDVPGDAKTVAVELGRDTVDVTFALVASPLATLSGTAVAANGQPVTSGLVMLLPLSGGDVRMMAMARMITGPDGAFRFRNVPSGSYVIQASAPGGNLVGQGGFGSLVVTAAPPDVSNLMVRVNPPASLRGHFVFEGGTPPAALDRLIVQPRPTNFVDGPIGGGPRPSKTNDDLTFEVKGLAGLNVLAVMAPAPWTVKRVTVGARDMTDTPIDFRSGDVNDVEVTLTSRAASVSGAVSEGDAPSTNYGVIVFAEDATKWTFPSRFIATGRPNQQGRFSLTGLPPADYLAIALPGLPATELDPAFLETLRARATRFSLGEGEAKTLDLKLVKR